MIVGIGVDLVDVARFERALSETPKLRNRLFSEAELLLTTNSLAARFAAKEALMKAVGSARGLSFAEVSVSNDAEGKPSFSLSGTTEQTIESAGIKKLQLSLSHDAGMAIAFVIAEGES
jgi:holo-[acyl-carrier protein] synthase